MLCRLQTESDNSTQTYIYIPPKAVTGMLVVYVCGDGEDCGGDGDGQETKQLHKDQSH